jgi:hypothetical protein
MLRTTAGPIAMNKLADMSPDVILAEISRMTRRYQNHREIPEAERIQYAAYLCELWEALYLRQCQTVKEAA